MTTSFVPTRPRPDRLGSATEILAACAGLTAVLCLVGLTSRSLWIDEAVALRIAQTPGWRVFMSDGGNMPAYYLLLRIWTFFGDSLGDPATAVGAVCDRCGDFRLPAGLPAVRRAGRGHLGGAHGGQLLAGHLRPGGSQLRDGADAGHGCVAGARGRARSPNPPLVPAVGGFERPGGGLPPVLGLFVAAQVVSLAYPRAHTPVEGPACRGGGGGAGFGAFPGGRRRPRRRPDRLDSPNLSGRLPPGRAVPGRQPTSNRARTCFPA